MEKRPILDCDENGNEIEIAPIVNKISKFIWAGLGIGSLCGVIFAGAWWHLLTAGVCLAMYLTFKSEEKQLDKNGR